MSYLLSHKPEKRKFCLLDIIWTFKTCFITILLQTLSLPVGNEDVPLFPGAKLTNFCAICCFLFRTIPQKNFLFNCFLFKTFFTTTFTSFFQFETIPDWIPHGVLALQSPRLPWMNKKKMSATGSLLASALLALKDTPFPTLKQVHAKERQKSRQNSQKETKFSKNGKKFKIPGGGVFSGFTNRDFQTEGELDFVGEVESQTKNGGGEEIPSFLEILEKLPNLSCYEADSSERRRLAGRLTGWVKARKGFLTFLKVPQSFLRNLRVPFFNHNFRKWIISLLTPLSDNDSIKSLNGRESRKLINFS